jgi:hypothetical protein
MSNVPIGLVDSHLDMLLNALAEELEDGGKLITLP